MVQEICTNIHKGCQKYQVNQRDVLKLVVKYLRLCNEIIFDNDFVVCLPLATREAVWKFWVSNSDESTLTTHLAKMCVADKSKCQLDLKYVSTVKVVTIRGRKFCQSIWKVTFDQLLYMYQKHCQGNPDFLVLKGTFFNLKTFYAQNSSKKIWKCVSVSCICVVHGQ